MERLIQTPDQLVRYELGDMRVQIISLMAEIASRDKEIEALKAKLAEVEAQRPHD